jgi:hypothetical protein
MEQGGKDVRRSMGSVLAFALVIGGLGPPWRPGPARGAAIPDRSAHAASRPPRDDAASRIAREAFAEAQRLGETTGDSRGACSLSVLSAFDLEAAFRAAERTRGNPFSGEEIQSLAPALVRREAPPELRAAFPNWVLRLADYARAIKEEGPRAQALSTLARYVARRDIGAARRLWDEAIPLAEKVDDRRSRAFAVSAIAEDMARADWRRAVDVAGRIALEWQRTYTFQQITKRLAPVDLTAALAVARRPARRSEQIELLCLAAEGVAPRDRKRAAEILSAADEMTRRLEDCSVLSQLHLRLSGAWAGVNPRRALALLPPKLDSWLDERSRIALLSDIAVRFASEDLKQALAVARRVPVSTSSSEFTIHLGRGQTYCEIAMKIGRRSPARARSLLAEALANARSASQNAYRSQLLTLIAQAMAPLDPEQARSLLEQAADNPDYEGVKIENPEGLTAALTALPIDTALAAADHLKAKINQDAMWVIIARGAARRAPERALAIARQVHDGLPRLQALCGVAEALLPLDEEE